MLFPVRLFVSLSVLVLFFFLFLPFLATPSAVLPVTVMAVYYSRQAGLCQHGRIFPLTLCPLLVIFENSADYGVKENAVIHGPPRPWGKICRVCRLADASSVFVPSGGT